MGQHKGERVNPSDEVKIRLFMEIGRRDQQEFLFSAWSKPDDKANWMSAWENIFQYAKR